jgi:hypothetical protein
MTNWDEFEVEWQGEKGVVSIWTPLRYLAALAVGGIAGYYAYDKWM